jgi:hypothetical protein
LKKDILGAIAVIVVLSIFLGITVLIMHIKETHLRKEGIISIGIVTYCAEKQTIHIAYHFRASDGIVYNGKRGVNKKYDIGDTVYVIYLENNPKKHKMIDKFSEHDQNFLQDVQVRLDIYDNINTLK